MRVGRRAWSTRISDWTNAVIFGEVSSLAPLHAPFTLTATFPRGLVIAYRVLRHPIELKPPLQQNTRTSSVCDSDGVRTSSSAAGNDDTMDNDPLVGSGSTLMVVVPGLFQTLDTLGKAVLPLVNAHPGLTALLVAPPGLPNTHWPAAISLDGEVCLRMPPR